MISIKKRPLLYILALTILACACVHKPKLPNPQYTWQNYKFSVLLAPEMLNASPKLDVALSLIQMEYPAGQAEYFKEVVYSAVSLDSYREQVIREQREIYRNMAVDTEEAAASADKNWWRTERVDIIQNEHRGIIAVRDLSFYTGGEHSHQNKRYYVIDMEDSRLLRIEDFFASFQEETVIRELVYEELRKFSELAWGRPLTDGIYFSKEPEITFNFFFTEDGLGLHWDPDQIAPYDNGEIEIILPWQIIRPTLLYTGIELLTKFNIHLFSAEGTAN